MPIDILLARRPGTHGAGLRYAPETPAAWSRAQAQGGRLVDFRSYLTGEVFGLLARHSTIGQLMRGEAIDAAAFGRGLARAKAGGGRELLHNLFGSRALALFGGLAPEDLRGYLSGLLIGAEFCDAVEWAGRAGDGPLIGVGNPAMVTLYSRAAAEFGLDMVGLDSDGLLPDAIFAIAATAGLLPPVAGGAVS